MLENIKVLGYLKKFLYLFSGNQKSLLALVCLFLVASVSEAIGIGMIGGFLKLADNPGPIINSNQLLDRLYAGLGFGSTTQFVFAFGIFVILIFILKSFLYFASQYFTSKLLLGQRKILQDKFFDAYSSAPYELYLSRNSSDLVNKIIVETSRFIYGFSNSFVMVLSQSITLLALLALLVRTDVNLLFAVLFSLTPAFAIFLLLSGRIREWGQLFSTSNEEIARLVNHSLGGIKEIRVIGCEDYFKSEMKNSTKQLAQAELLFYMFQAVPRTLIEMVLVICVIGFLCLSILLRGQEFQTVLASVGVFALAGMKIIPAGSLFISSMAATRNSTHTLNLLYSDLKEVEEISQSSGLAFYRSVEVANQASLSILRPPISFNQQIQIENLTYRYPGASDLSIDQINISIKKGQSIGLIGRSGAGKTTLVDLLLGLLQPESGDIKVDGHSIYENLDSWRRNIGYIPQSIFLLDDTIERNIALGVPDRLIDHSRLRQAIQLAQLEELLADTPGGINTPVGERGIRLSGGQRQRIGIARALYHERDILVLDEATSALDNATERLVNQAIESLAGLKTLVVIAHRLTTIEHCDCIYMLDKGRVIRSGSYESVVHSVQ
jgi:ABC-type multidrug transport system fused ATPase/permease subunit